MGHIAGVNRHEAIALPERLADYIADDNPIRFIDAFVDELDLAALGFQRVQPAATGRPAYHPGDLLKLYIYGYWYRVRSSRRLEQETQRNVEVMWRLKKLRPDHKTIATFRRDNGPALRQVCRAFPLLCKQLELFGGELVAVDGSKCKAVNAKERNFKPATLQRLIANIAERVERYLHDLDHVDTDEDDGTQHSGAVTVLHDKIARLRERTLLYQSFQAHLAAHDAEQLSLTDPASRAMILGKGRGTEVGYNVQTAVDAKHTLIVANEVTNDPGDRDWLSPMALQAQAVLNGTFDVVADVGYYHGHEVKTCVDAGITP